MEQGEKPCIPSKTWRRTGPPTQPSSENWVSGPLLAARESGNLSSGKVGRGAAVRIGVELPVLHSHKEPCLLLLISTGASPHLAFVFVVCRKRSGMGIIQGIMRRTQSQAVGEGEVAFTMLNNSHGTGLHRSDQMPSPAHGCLLVGRKPHPPAGPSTCCRRWRPQLGNLCFLKIS